MITRGMIGSVVDLICFAAFISGILFVLELVIQESNYTLRSLLKIPLIWGVFVSMIGFVVLGSLFAGRQFEMELSNAEKEKQKEEIAAFFAAFVQESLDEDDEGDVEEIVASVQASEGGVRASLTKRAGPSQMSSNSDQLQPHDAMQSYRRKSSIVSGFSSNKFGGSKLSLAHAKKLEPIIQKAKTSGLITNADARLLLKAIRNNDPLVYLLFKRCNGDFMVFKELLHIQAIHLFDEKFAGVAGDDLQLGTNKVGQSITSLGYPVSIQQQPPPLAHKLKDAAIIEEDE
ncbi:hypothetical protein BDR26DRAFT_333568 [Obelidium mucronatum]|nr:hypothetical protein BDR26DRAFT_333568 [Obelidium mucronatum]